MGLTPGEWGIIGMLFIVLFERAEERGQRAWAWLFTAGAAASFVVFLAKWLTP